ncbi:MAG: hypothetical protein ACRDZZ_12270 [Ilumatobacteraceae bacterium]
MLSFLPVAVCGLVMWVCMRMMRRPADKPTEAASAQEVEGLRAELHRLRAELDEKNSAQSADENR